MMKRLLLCGLILVALPAGADLQTDMMNDRLDRLDREMTLLQKKVYAAEPTTVASPALEVSPSASAIDELSAQLDEQNKVITELTQKVEELTHAQAVLSEKLQHLNDDVDVRFQEQKPAQPAPKEQAKKLSDRDAYDAAYDLLIKTKYAEAEKAFSAFLTDYPNSDLVGNANYWLGETYYVRGQYETAAGVFSDGLTKYEKSSKAPDNLLKLGLTMANMGKKDEACGFLKLMPEKFPKASDTLTQRAAQEAQKLACP